MGTTAQKLQAIQNSKAAIKAAIEAKGVSDVGDVLSQYATKIGQISGGGGESKYGATIDNMLGDVSNGVLNLPAEPFSFSSTEITSLAENVLVNKFAYTNLTSVDLPNLTDCGNAMSYAFANCQNLTSVNLPKLEHGTLQYTFQNCTALKELSLPMFNGVFRQAISGCTNIEKLLLPSMTDNSITVSNLNKLNTVDLSSLQSGTIRLSYCTALASVDLRSYTSGSMDGAFSGCSSLTSIDLRSYTSGSMASAFSGCSSLTSVDLSSLTSCTSFAQTFNRCTSLTSFEIPQNSATTSNHKEMFYGCSNLTSVKFNGDIPPSTSSGGAQGMFDGCTKLANVDMSTVTTIGAYGMYCTSSAGFKSNVTSIDLSNLTSVGGYGLHHTFTSSKLSGSLDLSKLTTIDQHGLAYAFSSCDNLSSVNLSGITGVTVTDTLAHTFSNCTGLETVDLSNLTTAGQSTFLRTFEGDINLKKVYLNKLSYMTGTASSWNWLGAFMNCSSLELIDFSEATAIPAFEDNSTFSGASSTFKIVVPDALYDQWIVATNWSAYASHIVKKSEYTP